MRPNLLAGDIGLVNCPTYNVKVPLTNVVLAHTGQLQRDEHLFAGGRHACYQAVGRRTGDVVEMCKEILLINDEVARYYAAEALQERVATGRTVNATRLTDQVQGSERRVLHLLASAARNSIAPTVVPKDET